MAKKNVWNNEHCRKYDTSEGFGSEDEWINGFKKRFAQAQIENTAQAENTKLRGCKTLKELKALFKVLIKEVHPDIAGNTEKNVSDTQNLISEFELMKNKLVK